MAVIPDDDPVMMFGIIGDSAAGQRHVLDAPAYALMRFAYAFAYTLNIRYKIINAPVL